VQHVNSSTAQPCARARSEWLTKPARVLDARRRHYYLWQSTSRPWVSAHDDVIGSAGVALAAVVTQ
jgi:hypothetical protein